MLANNISFEKCGKENKVLIVTLSRSEKLNAVNDELLNELKNVVEYVKQNPVLHSVIFTSATLKAFSAGIDVNYVKSIKRNEEIAKFFYELADVFEEIMQLPVTTIAAINGFAFGAGADLALACDIRIANNVACFRFPGPQFGVVLGTQRLIKEVGTSKAITLTLLNKSVESADALKYGILHEVVNDSNCFERAEQIALQMLEMPDSAVTTIRSLCRNTEDNLMKCSPQKYAEESILAVNFKEAFGRYERRQRR